MDAENGEYNAATGGKPKIELFIRASSVDRALKGATPFCQQWFMAFHVLLEKGLIDLTVFPVNLENPPYEYEVMNVTRRLPVCRVVSGVINGKDCAGQTCETNDEIELLLESFQCESLRMSKEKAIYEERRRAERVFEDMYRHLGQFVRSSDDNGALLLTDLRRLDDYLEEKGMRYTLGDEPSIVDCQLMPRLQHLRIAAAAYKQFSIPAQLLWLWRYIATMYGTQAFIASCPLDRDVLSIYETKHGVQPVTGSPKLMAPLCTDHIPEEVFELLEARQRSQSSSEQQTAVQQ